MWYYNRHTTCLVNRNGLFGIRLSPSKYLTRFLSENDTNDTVHNLVTPLNSGIFDQENHNIIANDYSSKNPREISELI